MKKTKFYYLIEPLDIDGDKNHDGFLISQYKITKNNHKIFTKNKYMTFKAFNEFIKDFKHKSLLKFKGGNNAIPQQNQKIIVMSNEEYNNYMNNRGNNQNNNQIQNNHTPKYLAPEQSIQGYPPPPIVPSLHPSIGHTMVVCRKKHSITLPTNFLYNSPVS